MQLLPAQRWNEGFSHPNAIRYDGSNLAQVREALSRIRERAEAETCHRLLLARELFVETGREADWGQGPRDERTEVFVLIREPSEQGLAHLGIAVHPDCPA